MKHELAACFAETTEAPPTSAEIDWYARRLPRGAGAVIDAMAGTGRLAFALAERGFNVHVSDDSAALLARCVARFEAGGREPTSFRQDLYALNVPFRYAGAIVARGGLQRLADSGAAARGLERLRAHLVPPGRVLLGFVVPAVAQHPPGAPIVEVQRVRLPDGSTITLRSELRVDAAARCLEWRERYERRAGSGVSAREDETSRLTWYDEAGAIALVQDAGYRNVRSEAFGASEGASDGAHRFAVTGEL